MNDTERAQGIHCAGLSVALPYSWARGVVDDFELSRVPLAPAWLAGAANLDGRIVAVVDLATWAQPEAAPTAHAASARSRLLLGGEGAEAFALRFTGLPTLLRCSPMTADTTKTLPPALQALVNGAASADASSGLWPVLDIVGLARLWAHALAH